MAKVTSGLNGALYTAVEAFKDSVREGLDIAKNLHNHRGVAKVDLIESIRMADSEGMEEVSDRSLDSRHKTFKEMVQSAFQKSHEPPPAPSQESFKAWENARKGWHYMPTLNPLHPDSKKTQKGTLKEASQDRSPEFYRQVHQELKDTVKAKYRYQPGVSDPSDFVFASNPETGELIAISKHHYRVAEAGRQAESKTDEAFGKGIEDAMDAGEVNPFKHQQLMQELKNQVLKEQADVHKVDDDGNRYVQQYNDEAVTDRQLANIEKMEELQRASDRGFGNLQYQAQLESTLDQMDLAQEKLDKLHQQKTRLETFIGMLERAVVRLTSTRAAGLFKGSQAAATRVITSLSMLSDRLHERSTLVTKKIPAQETVLAELNQRLQYLMDADARENLKNFEDAGFGYETIFGSDRLIEAELANEEAELDEHLSDLTPLWDDMPEVKKIVLGAIGEFDEQWNGDENETSM
ncbi:hypothetical protein [Sansalvadorimonas verongulae]|uniref:hypothetical protein n=1 Tax=Sansalvadorimonas verongulae TaxID=2172824 RepID=UPI0012BBF055|nr:hypothetical protein [Sansalvadorimonas verongulae]MTI14776.1 hypothetical protein [Sansalvadorimonas verongulae]